MSVLTQNRSTERMSDQAAIALISIPVKAATKIYQGSLVVRDGGYAAPARTATGLICAGLAESFVDNSAGANGDLSVTVRRGTFKYDNSAGGDMIAQANCGGPCYLVDDHTVALTDGSKTRSLAGPVHNIDSDGVWVEVGMETLATVAAESVVTAQQTMTPGFFYQFANNASAGTIWTLPPMAFAGAIKEVWLSVNNPSNADAALGWKVHPEINATPITGGVITVSGPLTVTAGYGGAITSTAITGLNAFGIGDVVSLALDTFLERMGGGNGTFFLLLG